jgi:hypothetical protein
LSFIPTVNATASPARRCAAAAVLLALLAAGCGGSSHGTQSATTAGGGTSTQTVTAAGPPSLSANIRNLMRTSNPELQQLKLDCPVPAGPVKKFPVACKLTAIDSGRPPGPVGKPHAVTGTVKVYGVDAKTRTYIYQVLYAPVRR